MTNAFDRPDKPLAIQRPYGPKPIHEREEYRKPQSIAGLKKRLERKNPWAALGHWTTKDKI